MCCTETLSCSVGTIFKIWQYVPIKEVTHKVAENCSTADRRLRPSWGSSASPTGNSEEYMDPILENEPHREHPDVFELFHAALEDQGGSSKAIWFCERLVWNPAESLVCNVSRQLNVLQQTASCFIWYDIRDITIHGKSRLAGRAIQCTLVWFETTE
ncbi:hypothetical protein CSKR_109969 [Clonorchis sinensis]|uniref:Uncharacterized protein n=1 Tax=Clonorchis sinensis TaxID=79923 RepID=A0A3R7GJF6_CLOSI|nr:hypothetical protein CSKR_109969 [Clonorchis sinensis]